MSTAQDTQEIKDNRKKKRSDSRSEMEMVSDLFLFKAPDRKSSSRWQHLSFHLESRNSLER